MSVWVSWDQVLAVSGLPKVPCREGRVIFLLQESYSNLMPQALQGVNVNIDESWHSCSSGQYEGRFQLPEMLI